VTTRAPVTPFALVGPTASGKSALALHLAERFGAEIVSCDSMTIYRGMEIGTAKPSTADRARIPHHLIDIADPGERFTVARFQDVARAAMDDIAERGARALVSGGSGLYFRAAVDPLEFPPSDAVVRARLEQTDPAELAARLKELDPEAAAFVDARIERRLRGMLETGLLDEVRGLVARGFRDAVTSPQAIGYRDALGLLEGEFDDEEFVRRAARDTRRLARKQMSWFRADPRVRWFDATDAERAAAEIAAYYAEEPGE